MGELKEEECEYCFGAKELTRNGKLLIPCPVCKGGELKGPQLALANKRFLEDLKELDSLNEEE
jgi:hypothetical protein